MAPKTVQQDEWLSHRSSSNLIDQAGRHHFDVVEDADAGEDGVLGVDQVERVARWTPADRHRRHPLVHSGSQSRPGIAGSDGPNLAFLEASASRCG
jgi:hypothetical protein